MERKKILFLITKSNYGGAQRYVYDLATSLPRDQFEVVVALGGTGVLIDMLQTASVDVIRIPGLQRDISFKKEITSLQELRQIIKDEKPDVLHLNSSKAALLGAILGRICGVQKIVFTAHGWAFNEDRPSIERFILKILHWVTVLLSHKTIAVSNMTKLQMNWPLISSKIQTIRNGRTTHSMLSKDESRNELTALVPELTQYVNDLWIGTVAELHPVKQHALAIEALAKIITTFPTLRYIIVGEGTEKGTLSALIRAKHLQNNVFLVGHIDDAAHIMKAFDVFTLTSKSEALAYVLLEAAQAGVPIVATKVGGIPEIIIDDVHGYLVPDADVGGVASAYTKLLNDETLRHTFSKNIFQQAKLFSVEKMLEDTIAIYNAR
ncbi:MAG: glycosyltransferase involved in cell wall biosynthesis [Candidatus Azotimanducaceae bacterium]|jgi:glycosyltransferase involved in cell wall biosynthesis